MTGSREGFGNDKPLWKQRRGHLLQFPDHKATEKENLGKSLGKTKEKERPKIRLLQYGVISTDLDGALFNVNVAVSNA